MEPFGVWLWKSDLELAEVALLRTQATNLGKKWPIASLRKADYEASLRSGLPEPYQADAVKSLNALWAVYEIEQRASAPARKNTLLSGFVANLPSIAVAVPGIILIGLFLYGFSDAFLGTLSRVESARGLLTYLFGLTTVGIAIIVVLAVFLSSGTREELAERFQRGKDILTVLIGVFGAILGFYFGSDASSGSIRERPAALPTSGSSTQAPAAPPGTRLGAPAEPAPQNGTVR